MKRKIRIGLLFVLFCASCQRTQEEELVLMQIQDRNGLSETISDQEKLAIHSERDFLGSQPYKKVFRLYRKEGKNRSVITTYHPNGSVWQFLEAREMRAFGAYREWFPDGTPKIEAEVIGGTADLSPSAQESWLFHGEAKVWNDKGVLIAQIPYEKGSLFGTSRLYYPSGALERESPYVQDNIDGEEKVFWETGQIKQTMSYRAGCRDGVAQGFWPDGKPSSMERYEEGRLMEGTYWDMNQTVVASISCGLGSRALFDHRRLVRTEEIQNGVPDGLIQCFSSSGALRSIHHLKNGKKQGEEIEYYLEGGASHLQPKLSLNWDQDSIHGTVKTWYPNGQMESQREIYKNKKMGISCAWYVDGKLMLFEEYENDSLLRGQYYKKNQSSPVSSVISGNGVATLFDKEGLFLSKITYVKGKPVDPE